MVNRLLVGILLLLLSSSGFAKSLVAQVDRNEIGIDESIELVVVLSGATGQQPDMSEVYKHFSLERRSQSSNLSIMNGVVGKEVKWQFVLIPNRKGRLLIPPIKVAGLITDPIEIQVSDVSVAQSSNEDVLMEVEVRPLHPYVGGQVIYIQRLYYSRPLVHNASITQPKLSEGEADLEYLGASNPRNVKHNGRSYQLIERFYAAFPKQSGVLRFNPSVFRGSLADNSSRRNQSRMPMFQAGMRVSAYSAQAELKIEDKPATFTGNHWLPASQVSLSMNWSQSPETLKAGQPISVTIMLMAEGVKAETLPEVRLSLPDNLKIYPEKPSFRSDKGGNGITGLREEKFTLVANEQGEYQVPAVEVSWWNTNTDKQEVARLEGFLIKVVGGAGTSSQNTQRIVTDLASESAKKSPVKAPANTDSHQEPDTSFISQAQDFYEDNKLLVLITTPTLFGLLFLGLFMRKKHRANHEVDRSVDDELEAANEFQAAKDSLIQACKANDAKAAISALPAWAETVGISPPTLAGIEQSQAPLLSDAMRELAQAHYSSQEDVMWQGNNLLQAVEQYLLSEPVSSEDSTLQPLHPIS